MADYDQIMRALRNAHAAGDTAAATRLAQMAQEARQQPAQERGIGQRLYDNIIGDPNDGVTSTGEALGTWLNRGGESMTLGVVGDEASAAVTAPIKRGLAAVGLGGNADATYAGERDRFRANEDNMSTMGKLSADVVGAIVPGALGIGAVAQGATRAAQIKRAAGLGAGAGLLQGFMEGEGSAGERAGAAVVPAVIGAAAGAATPYVAAAAGRGVRNVQDWAANRNITSQIADTLGIQRKSGGLLADILGMDDPQRMRQALGRNDAMLADAGPTAQGALDAAIQSPGEGARTALGRIEARAGRAGAKLTETLDEALPAQVPAGRQFTNTAQMQGDIRRATAAERQSLYTAAYSRPIDYSAAEGAALLDDVAPRLPQEAISYANRLMRLRGEKSPQIMASIADDGSVAFTNPPDVRQWDYIKQALDGLAESGDGAGALGGQTRLGSAYQGLAREIRGNLGRAVPEYDTAVNRAGDIIGEVQAIKTGEQLLSARITRAEAESALDGMSAAELAAVKRGLRQSIDDRIAQVRAVATDPNVDAREVAKAYGELSSRAARDKMRMLLGDSWSSVEKSLDEAGQALGLRARVATNSRTFGRQQFGELLAEGTEPGAIRKGEVVGTAKSAWQGVTGATPDRVARQRAGIRNEIADVLTRPNAQGLLQMIEAARLANRTNPMLSNQVAAGVGAGLLGMIGQTSSGLAERLR